MRTLSLVSLGVTLVVVAFMWTRSTQDTVQATSRAQDDAARVTAAFNLQQAMPALQAWFAEHGTYAGAVPPAETGVVVVRADATSYCLQAGSVPNVEHLVGPSGNAPIDGSC
jgi:hypothetical protein